MKRKEILMLIFCLVVIGGSIFFMVKMMAPKNNTNTQSGQENVQTEITGNIDENTLDELKKLNDYGEATLEGIGKANPFGTIN